MHVRTILPVMLLAFSFSTGCKRDLNAPASNEASTGQAASSEPSKSVTADISGDYTQHFSSKDGAVNIGLLGSIRKHTARFTISASDEGANQTTELSTGFIVPFQLAVGTPQNSSGASIGLVHGESKTDYGEPTYRLFYDPQAESPPIAHVTLSKADQVPSGNAMIVRYRLVGTFDYLAAYAPSPGTACAHEALAYVAAHGRRYPKFKADLCQAKKVSVKGSFDITQDFPSSTFE